MKHLAYTSLGLKGAVNRSACGLEQWPVWSAECTAVPDSKSARTESEISCARCREIFAADKLAA